MMTERDEAGRNRFRHCPALLLAVTLLLPGCASGSMSSFSVSDLSLPHMAMPSFHTDRVGAFFKGLVDRDGRRGLPRVLAHEYRKVALERKAAGAPPAIIDHLTQKAVRAGKGEAVRPDRPVAGTAPTAEGKALIAAYQRLVIALDNKDSNATNASLAVLQSRFDCWLSSAAAGSKQSAIACYEAFDAAFKSLELPVPDPSRKQPGPAMPTATATVYFSPESIALTNSEAAKLDEIASGAEGREDGWTILLRGYTDTREQREGKTELSMRRAVSVKNALAQRGVAMNMLQVDAFGEAPEGSKGDDALERRVDIELVPDAVAATRESSHIEQMLPENFGSDEPVF